MNLHDPRHKIFLVARIEMQSIRAILDDLGHTSHPRSDYRRGGSESFQDRNWKSFVPDRWKDQCRTGFKQLFNAILALLSEKQNILIYRCLVLDQAPHRSIAHDHKRKAIE